MYILITVDSRTAFSSHFCWWNHVKSIFLIDFRYSHVISRPGTEIKHVPFLLEKSQKKSLIFMFARFVTNFWGSG